MSTAPTTGTRTIAIDATYEAVLDPSKFTSAGRITSGPLEGTTVWTGRAAAAHPEVNGTPFDGAMSYTGELEIRTSQGSLRLSNVGVFEPKPFGTVSGAHRVISGTGAFEGANGDLFWYGRATNEAGTQFVKSLRGHIHLMK